MVPPLPPRGRQAPPARLDLTTPRQAPVPVKPVAVAAEWSKGGGCGTGDSNRVSSDKASQIRIMSGLRTSFRFWWEWLGEPVPLERVPQLLLVGREQVIGAVHEGWIRVSMFRADNGTVFRMVPRMDIRAYGKNPLTHQKLTAALRRMMDACGDRGSPK